MLKSANSSRKRYNKIIAYCILLKLYVSSVRQLDYSISM